MSTESTVPFPEEVRGPPNTSYEADGHIKWFSSAKRYGFVVPENSPHDAFIHATTLSAGGFESAPEGARTRCIFTVGDRGLVVEKVLSLDETHVAVPTAENVRAAMAAAKNDWTSEWTPGVVKWFNKARGYGFITCGSDLPDIFVHITTIQHYGLAHLHEGIAVDVRYGSNEKRLFARAIRLVAQ